MWRAAFATFGAPGTRSVLSGPYNRISCTVTTTGALVRQIDATCCHAAVVPSLSRYEGGGTLRTLATRSLTVVGRAVAHPSLVPEIGRKIRSRLTATRHRRRIGLYADLTMPPIAALSRMLDVTPAEVERAMDEPSLAELIAELETYAVGGGALTSGPGFMEACYAITRIVRPTTVVETGVAWGFSSAAILQALESNGSGRLYSVDLPAFRPGAQTLSGAAVPERLRKSGRWHLDLGPDRRMIPRVLHNIDTIDLFVYDSDKSYAGMRHTWALVWPRLSAGALMMLDDIHLHDALLDFADAKGVSPLIMHKPAARSVYRSSHIYSVGMLRKPPQ